MPIEFRTFDTEKFSMVNAHVKIMLKADDQKCCQKNKNTKIWKGQNDDMVSKVYNFWNPDDFGWYT